ncbi:MAG: hypothetical protein LBP69_03425 [Treponema sp.]|jgi:hypothetical protein|nr:hypothetical protein [Treponema sp.]
MGLLGKAVLNEHPSQSAKNPEIERGLDEMGKALRDRILSLSGAEPETAISLLKAYGSFRVGACLSLENGMYRSYAAVGTGNPIELPVDLLRKIPDGNRYSVDYNPRDSIRGIPAGTRFWAFSLDENGGDPPVRILLAGEDKNYIFPAEAVGSLIQATKSAFAPLKKTEQTREEKDDFSPAVAEIVAGDDFSSDNVPPIPVSEGEERFPAKKTKGGLLALAKKHSTETVPGAVVDDSTTRTVSGDSDEKKNLSFRSAVLKKYGSVQGLVFEGEGQADVFASRINKMVSSFADTTELRAGRCLITGGQSLDRELLSHRLSASVPGKKLLCFNAENPGEALGALKAYL